MHFKFSKKLKWTKKKFIYGFEESERAPRVKCQQERTG